MQFTESAYALLEPHWKDILQHWQGKVPEFVSEIYVKKYLPFLQIPADEEEIWRRVRRIIARCSQNEAESLCMFVLHYCTFVLNLQPYPALQSAVWGEDEGVAALLAALSSCPLIIENCRKRDIPEHYAFDAMQWIGGTVITYKLGHNNIPGHPLQQLYWLGLHVEGKLYRIGRFEYLLHRLPDWVPLILRNAEGVFAILAAPGVKFDADGWVTLKDDAVIESFIEEDGDFITGIPCDADGHARVNERLTVDRREFKPVCSPWDIIPSVHIPGGSPMRWEDALASMKAAKEFFKRYFKREIPMLVCNSWILNPALEKFAPEGNMAKFRKECFCVPIRRRGTGRDGMLFSFGRDDVDPVEVEAVNSVQKILQEIFKAEGTLRTGAMFILTDDLDKLGNMYYRNLQKVL